MSKCSNQVRPISAPSKALVSEAIGLDWHHVATKTGKSTFAACVDANEKTINRTLTGETVPELHTALASLLVDRTALQRTLALYGVQVVPLTSSAANDMETVACLSDLVTQFLKVLEDGIRDHQETLQLARSITPIIDRLNGIVQDARVIEGVAA